MGVQTEVGGKIDALHNRINDVVEKRITPLELWRENIVGKITILTGFIAVGFSFLSLWVKDKFFKNV